jgi:hypothetical protein
LAFYAPRHLAAKKIAKTFRAKAGIVAVQGNMGSLAANLALHCLSLTCRLINFNFEEGNNSRQSNSGSRHRLHFVVPRTASTFRSNILWQILL